MLDRQGFIGAKRTPGETAKQQGTLPEKTVKVFGEKDIITETNTN